jgi:hypothetical protein
MAGYLRDILDNYPDLDGVILDHLEFPSYTADALFTCFCDGCHAKAKSYGYDFNDLKQTALKFYSWIKNLDKRRIERISEDGMSPVDTMAEIFSHEDFVNWWQLKFKSTTELAGHIREIVNEVDPSLELHIDCVAPSFAPLSGVNVTSLSRYCNMFNPKFYPSTDYWGWHARLTSYADLIREGKEIDESVTFKFIVKLFGLKGLLRYKSINELKNTPLPTELFRNEAEKAIELFGDKRRIRPWVRLDYALTSEIRNMVRAIADAGLEGAFFRYYSAATEEKLDIIQEEFGK